MVELQSRATLVNVSALSAELQRERQKNAELMRRISVLEAQIRDRNKKEETILVTDIGQGKNEAASNYKRSKRRKLEMVGDIKEKGNREDFKSDMTSQNNAAERSLVNWMSIDDTQNLHLEKFKDSDCAGDFDETDSDDNYDDHDHIDNGHRNAEVDVRQEEHEHQKMNEVKTHEETEIEETEGYYCTAAPQEARSSGFTSVPNRNRLKVAFCPKEVKSILESEVLLQKNAQSHTIRKIIVFASLGIRHGCEDMCELDFNHFSILKKGEPYISPRNPGEHVLYENPGVRRKIFYPNRENPILCPVQILEEERLMRPSDASCPSCLFLCIKYGGRTRNLPQNEYVRQRMGRNKLKSFGPMICRMAILAHIRSGSFFFKALGITLLFMAGFPDNIVQRETKYRNLDLLQKYYRKDEDAAEEELFLPRPIACDNHVTAETQSSTRKSLLAKAGGKKHTNSMNRSQSLQIQMKTSAGQSIPASSGPSQFGLTGYSSSHTLAMAAFHSAIPSQISQNTSQTTNKHASYQMLPPQPTSAYVPLVYWPPPPIPQ
ncbi:uncharacterized protein LOC129287099 isoform X2 [Prosopis cineraria]|uniref:uncharacterized protein LOC129287099 isoform X2 n=1 Tax=Prosopis cineraria TaxID=364024 RepID=UPI00240EAB91|nr:uncharacterized protein LOC129287099 isoform X2 [Prosopis cineraria]